MLIVYFINFIVYGVDIFLFFSYESGYLKLMLILFSFRSFWNVSYVVGVFDDLLLIRWFGYGVVFDFVYILFFFL